MALSFTFPPSRYGEVDPFEVAQNYLETKIMSKNGKKYSLLKFENSRKKIMSRNTIPAIDSKWDFSTIAHYCSLILGK